jgi:sodium transport system permease protein
MRNRIRNIWFKELMDTTRDRKAMRQTLLIPLIIGVVYAMLNPLLNNVFQNRAEETASLALSVPTIGVENATPDLLALLLESGIELAAYAGDLAAAVEAGDESVGLVIPSGFAEQLDSAEPAQLTVLSNPTAGDLATSGLDSSRLFGALTAYDQLLVSQRLTERGIDPSILTAVQVNRELLTTPEQAGSINAQLMLPILIAVVVVSGGLFIAIDVTAGEKERGTLESLLATPATDVEIFLGKLLAVFTMTTIPLVLTFVAFGLATNLTPDSIGGGAVLPLSVIVGSIIVGLPLALAVNVIMMIVAVRTKTFKDAQSASAPITFAVIFPAMGAAFVPAKSLAYFLIPVYGSGAVINRLSASGTLPIPELIASTIGCLIVAAIGLVIALRLFDRERLLYSM